MLSGGNAGGLRDIANARVPTVGGWCLLSFTSVPLASLRRYEVGISPCLARGLGGAHAPPNFSPLRSYGWLGGFDGPLKSGLGTKC